MANDNLKNALRSAGLTTEQFAAVIEVDPKTVQRWVSGRTPYPRHRATVARALDLTEHELWPDDVPAPTADPSPAQPAQSSAGVGDVTGSWGQATEPDAPQPAAFVSSASDHVDLLDDGRGLTGMPGLIDALLAQARDGCQIRVLTFSLVRELEPLIGHDAIELRVYQAASGHTLIRTGDQILLTLSFPSGARRAPVLLQLHRRSDGGMFDRLAVYYQLLWDNADKTITNLEQLDACLENEDQTPGTNHDTPPTANGPFEPTDRSSEPSSSRSPEHARAAGPGARPDPAGRSRTRTDADSPPSRAHSDAALVEPQFVANHGSVAGRPARGRTIVSSVAVETTAPKGGAETDRTSGRA
jgi:DNA-binding transcriptional regulator YdaS (Cro superfamily)